MPLDLSKIKSSQDRLKAQAEELEKSFANRPAPVMERWSMEDEETRQMIATVLRQNRRLAERLDHVMAVIMEAAQSAPDDTIMKTLAALTKSQVEVLELLAGLQERVEDVETVKLAELKKLHAESDEKLKSLADTISKMPFAQQIDVLKKETDSIVEEMKTIEALVTTEIPDVLKYDLQVIKTDAASLGEKITSIESELRKVEEDEGKLLPQIQSLADLKKKTEDIERKLSGIEETDKGFVSFGSELKSIRQEIGSVSEEVKTVEKRLESGGPEKVVTAVLDLKNYVEVLGSRLDSVSSELGKVERGEEEMGPHVALIDNLQSRIGELSAKLAGLEKIVLEKEMGLGTEDRQKLSEVHEKLRSLDDEMSKVEKWIETYPIGDAQQISFIRQRFDNLSQELDSLKQGPAQSALKEELDAMKEQLASLEKTFSEQGIDHEKRREAELTLITTKLKSMEDEIKSLESGGAFEKSFSDIRDRTQKVADQMEDLEKKLAERETGEEAGIKKSYLADLTHELSALREKLESVESAVRDERLVSSAAIESLHKGLVETRSEIEAIKGKPVKAGVVEEMGRAVREVEVPDVKRMKHEHKEAVLEAKETLEAGAEKMPALEEAVGKTAAKGVREELAAATEQAVAVEAEIKKTEGEVMGAKAAVSDIKEKASEAVLRDEEKVMAYLMTALPGVEVKASLIARDLGMKPDDVLQVLIRISKERPDSLVLRDTGYGAHLMGKEPSAVRLK
jgi:DNA repair exonuclease SbcCD ATPase subunit